MKAEYRGPPPVSRSAGRPRPGGARAHQCPRLPVPRGDPGRPNSPFACAANPRRRVDGATLHYSCRRDVQLQGDRDAPDRARMVDGHHPEGGRSERSLAFYVEGTTGGKIVVASGNQGGIYRGSRAARALHLPLTAATTTRAYDAAVAVWQRQFTIGGAIWAVVISGAALPAGCGSRRTSSMDASTGGVGGGARAAARDAAARRQAAATARAAEAGESAARPVSATPAVWAASAAA